jgi:type VI secretion system protein ImpH
MAYSNRLAKRYLEALTANTETLYELSFEALLRYLDANSPLHERLGYSISLKQDGFRLGQTAMLHFHSSAFSNVVEKPAAHTFQINNVFWGLFGINGPLPNHLTEYAIEREHRYKDTTLVAFCNLFHHRFLSLYYRAWAEAQPTVSYDFSIASKTLDIKSKTDRFGQKVASLGGASKKQQPSHLDLSLAGLFTLKNKSVGTLQQLLQCTLRHPVKVEQFVGTWYTLPEAEQSALGVRNHQLGLRTTLGKRSFQRSFSVAIYIGPLCFDEYMALLKNKHSLMLIRQMAHKTIGYEFSITLHLKLAAAQKRMSFLNTHTSNEPCVLGQNSWICSQRDTASKQHIVLTQVSDERGF